MDATKLNELRAMAGNTNVEVDRALVLDLITAHETQQRAESFWSVRAPAMADEIERLREVERNVRAVSVAIAALSAPASDLAGSVQDLDALRAKQAAA